MKIAFIFIVLISQTALTQSADFKVKWAAVEEGVNQNAELLDAVAFEEYYILLESEVIRGRGGFNYFLKSYSRQMKLLSTKEITAEFKGLDWAACQLYRQGESVGIISMFCNSETGVATFEYAHIEPASLALTNKREFLKAPNLIKEIPTGATFQTSQNGDFNFIYLSGLDYRTGQSQTRFYVLDDKLDVLWKETQHDMTGKWTWLTQINDDASLTLITTPFTSLYDTSGYKFIGITTMFDGTIIEDSIYIAEDKIRGIVAKRISDTNYGVFGYGKKEDKHSIIYFDISTETMKETKLVQSFDGTYLDVDSYSGHLVIEEQQAQSSAFTAQIRSSFYPLRILSHSDGSISLIGHRFAGGAASDIYISTIRDGNYESHLTVSNFTPILNVMDIYYDLSYDDNTALIFHDHRDNIIDRKRQDPLKLYDGKNETKSLALALHEDGEFRYVQLIDYANKALKGYDPLVKLSKLKQLTPNIILGVVSISKRESALFRIHLDL
ncbi:hypothetical protein JYT72_01460 [Crocinitomix catalasitica]|nr:hypothetical protein [Crocinitomix catalasitica]